MKTSALSLMIGVCVGLWARTALAQEVETRLSAEDPGLFALLTAASVLWVVLLSLVVYQFHKQRQLAEKLTRMERTLDDLNESSERAEEECSISSQPTNSNS